MSKGNKEGSAGEEEPRGLIPEKLVEGGCRRTGCSLVVSMAELPGGQAGACCTGKLGSHFLGEQFEGGGASLRGSVGRMGSEEGRQQSHE